MSSVSRHATVRLGRVVANTGRDVLVLIDSHAEERPTLRMGDVVLAAGRNEPAVGVISGINAPAPGLEGDGEDLWVIQVELTGSLKSDGDVPVYSRGVPASPALGSVVHLATTPDLKLLHRNADETALPIGDVQGINGVKATVDPDMLLDGGFAIMGASGTGKSASLACIVRALLRARFPIHALLIDPYNEFGTSFGKAASVIEPRPGLFPHWLLTYDELVWVLSMSGDDLDRDERALLDQAIPSARRNFLQRHGQIMGSEGVSIDAPIPYRVTDLLTFIEKAAEDLGHSLAVRSRLRGRLMTAIADPRLSIIFGTAATTDNLSTLLCDLFRLDRSPPLAVLQLGRLTAGLDKLIVSVVCRLAAALAEWSGISRHTLVLMDNAERYAPAEVQDEASRFARDAIRVLGGRPRKLGTALGLTASSPRNIDRDVLIRCGTMFLHRMPSTLDGDAVEEILSEPAPACIDSLGALQQREAMTVGRGISFAGRVMMSELPAVAIPGSRPMPTLGEDIETEIAETINRWRRFGAGEAPPSADNAA
ncbi:ATP-binding protein [Parvularcula marina]